MLEKVFGNKSPREVPLLEKGKASRKETAQKTKEARGKARTFWGIAPYAGRHPYNISQATRTANKSVIELLHQGLARADRIKDLKGAKSALKAILAYIELAAEKAPKKTSPGHTAVKNCVKPYEQRLNDLHKAAARDQVDPSELDDVLTGIRKQAEVELQKTETMADQLAALGLTPRIREQKD
jgi:hypothetical protein